MRTIKVAPELEKKVDMTKVNIEVLRSWITKKCIELLGTEDEVLINFVMDMLSKDRVRRAEHGAQTHRRASARRPLTSGLCAPTPAPTHPRQFPDGKLMQVNLTGFFERHTPQFMQQLWTLLLSAQDSVGACEHARSRRRSALPADPTAVPLEASVVSDTGGIPRELLESKKEEIRQKKVRLSRVHSRRSPPPTHTHTGYSSRWPRP